MSFFEIPYPCFERHRLHDPIWDLYRRIVSRGFYTATMPRLFDQAWRGGKFHPVFVEYS